MYTCPPSLFFAFKLASKVLAWRRLGLPMPSEMVNAIMNATLIVDKAGRVVLPKPVRDEMQLRAGDSLELESSEDRIVLRPRRGESGMHKKQGIWVFNTGEPISAEATDDLLRQIRRDRELSFLGNRPVRASRRKKRR